MTLHLCREDCLNFVVNDVVSFAVAGISRDIYGSGVIESINVQHEWFKNVRFYGIKVIDLNHKAPQAMKHLLVREGRVFPYTDIYPFEEESVWTGFRLGLQASSWETLSSS